MIYDPYPIAAQPALSFSSLLCGKTMKRELSVEDLFAPLNRLDVCHYRDPSSSTSSSSSSSSSALADVVEAGRPNPRTADVLPSEEVAKSEASPRDPCCVQLHADLHGVSSFSARRESASVLELASIPEEVGSPSHTQKLSTPALELAIDHNSEEGTSSRLGMVSCNNKGCMPASKGSSSLNNSSATVVDYVGPQMQGNSTSDEDQQLVEDRKQRRMLSNRESARRSRLRKQQHLDELRGHVAQLQAQNSHMLNSFNLASKQFAQITEENQKLRSEAMNLSHQLQRLHHVVTSQRTNNGLWHSADSRQMVQGPQY